MEFFCFSQRRLVQTVWEQRLETNYRSGIEIILKFANIAILRTKLKFLYCSRTFVMQSMTRWRRQHPESSTCSTTTSWPKLTIWKDGRKKRKFAGCGNCMNRRCSNAKRTLITWVVTSDLIAYTFVAFRLRRFEFEVWVIRFLEQKQTLQVLRVEALRFLVNRSPAL